jgi:hypothetical protein
MIVQCFCIVFSGQGRVCHECIMFRHYAVHENDEGRPLAIGKQVQIANNLKRLQSKAVVVSVKGKGMHKHVMYESERRT